MHSIGARYQPIEGSGSPPPEERPADGRGGHNPEFESPPGYQSYSSFVDAPRDISYVLIVTDGNII